MKKLLIHPGAVMVRDALAANGFKCWFVGGCVRDAMIGVKPKDIDLCTDANPEEQIASYVAAGFTEKAGEPLRYVPTGLQHGTLTVVINGSSYEVTSLRTESEHDGRWAKMTYTRDLTEDLGRRDLTINAMAMDFDGNIIDPFGGKRDLERLVVRFVGNPHDRIREDYLRILRWLRFHARFAGGLSLDAATRNAVRHNAEGLRGISRERVWSEVSKIIAGDHAAAMFVAMHKLGLAEHIELPYGDTMAIREAQRYTRDPVSLMAAYTRDPEVMTVLAKAWKWSSKERAQGTLIAERINGDVSLRALKIRAAVNGEPLAWLAEAARVRGEIKTAKKLDQWEMPSFPVTGDDLKSLGVPQGPQVGQWMHTLKSIWGESGFVLNRDRLLDRVTA